jgi:glycerophosphoryl diester phosphodiesterase
LFLSVWTVNDVNLARQMIRVGVQSITTDRPGWLREQLGLSRRVP